MFAAHLGLQNLDLWIATPDPNPPRPWQAAHGGQVWRLPFAATAGLDAAEAGSAGALARDPGLVSLGYGDGLAEISPERVQVARTLGDRYRRRRWPSSSWPS